MNDGKVALESFHYVYEYRYLHTCDGTLCTPDCCGGPTVQGLIVSSFVLSFYKPGNDSLVAKATTSESIMIRGAPAWGATQRTETC